MKPYAPDDSGMTWGDKDKDREKNRNARGGDMSAFMPGQLRGLAKNLSWGFGGGMGRWKKQLRSPYSQTTIFSFGGGNGGGNGGGKDKPVGPDGVPLPDDGGHTPVYPQHRSAAPAGILASAVPVENPNGGLLSVPNNMNQLVETQLPPEILAILRAQQGM
jgi:hypothetical protein